MARSVKSKQLLTATVVLCAFLLAGCSSGAAPKPPSAPSQDGVQPTAGPTDSATNPSSAAGIFISQADYERSKSDYQQTKVVLFFDAKWCSTCKQARDNIQANPIPAGLTIVDVDFDAATDLRQQYGVTVQHTFIQVDAQGNPLAKWAGSVTAQEIVSQTV